MKWLFSRQRPAGHTQSSVLINGKLVEVATVHYAPTRGGTLIRFVRKECTLTLRAAAELLDMTAEELSGVESGKLELNEDQVEAVLFRLKWTTPERSISEQCRTTGEQRCHVCDDLSCGDNTST